MIDFEEINQAALDRLPELLLEQFLNGKIQGNEFICGDLAGNPGSSFKVNLTTCQWADFAHPGVSGRDPVSLFAAALNVSQGEAAKYLADRMGTTTKKTATKKAKQVDTWQPTPSADAPKSIVHPKLGRPSAIWEYRDQTGKLLMIVCRFDPPGGKKEVLPYSHWRDSSTGKTSWRWKALPAPRPLYGLDRLLERPEAPVLFCEGCKAADAGQRLVPGAVSMTWPGGSGAVDKADFGPIAGRRVAIWPDADEPGRRAADNVARRCLDSGAAEVSVIEPPPGKKDGWDLFDAEAEGWTPSQVSEWIKDHKKPFAAREIGLDRAKGANGAKTCGNTGKSSGLKLGYSGLKLDESKEKALLQHAGELLAPTEGATPEYPIEALGPLADACKAISEHGQVSHAMAGQCLLTTSALLAQSIADVRTLAGIKPLSLYGLTVAESGDGKSTAEQAGLHPVHERQRQESRTYRDLVKAATKDHKKSDPPAVCQRRPETVSKLAV